MTGAVEWILAACAATLAPHDIGEFDTSGEKLAMFDPLVLAYDFAEYSFDVPPTGGRIVVFEDTTEGRNSKLAIIFSEGDVTGGAYVSLMLVDAGMGSLFSEETFARATTWLKGIGSDANPYDDYFADYDNDPPGLERKIVPLPDGTPVPYVHTGWGDGAYPVFTLTDASGNVVAAYSDFMGCDDDGHWLMPPGVTLE